MAGKKTAKPRKNGKKHKPAAKKTRAAKRPNTRKKKPSAKKSSSRRRSPAPTLSTDAMERFETQARETAGSQQNSRASDVEVEPISEPAGGSADVGALSSDVNEDSSASDSGPSNQDRGPESFGNH